MMFDMYVSMVLGLSIGALTFYCYAKAFGDPTLALEHSNQAFGHVKRVNFRSKLVQILACRSNFVPSVWTINDV